MMFTLISHLFVARPGFATPVRGPLRESAATNRHWSALVGGLIIIAAGSLLAAKPRINLRLTRANFPSRELSKEAIDRALSGGRVLGALTILFGAFLLLLWYRWTH
jgi:hypothetical protein